MRFIEADWLYLLIVPFLLMPVIAVISRNRRKKQLEALLGANADSPDAVHLSRPARVWRHLLLIGAASALIVAAARPSMAAKLLPFEPKGRDIMVLCDVSRSMNAADIAPSRLKHARYILRQLSSREQGDRFGLVPFAGSAFLSCPLTSDPVTFNEYVDELSTDSVPVGGTNLEKALQVAEKAFAASESGNRAIVLLTDGEELQGDSSSFVRKLKERHIPLFIIGLGDPVNGAVIPRGEEGAGFVRDASGKVVTSRLNEKQLAALAAETGGIYCRSTVTDTGVEKLANAIAGLDRAARENVKRRIPVEEFPRALAAGLLLLVLFMLISEKKMPPASLLLLFGAFLLTGAGEKDADAVKPAAKPELVIPADPAGMYNLARELQLSGDPGYAGLYGKLLARRDTGRELAARAYNNLGAGIHQQCQKEIAAAQGQVGKQQLDQALKALEQAAGLAGSAGELYSRAAAGAAAIPEFGANLTRLARDRKQIEELKKKIEELKKQQKKAQDKTRQARDQNKQQQKQQNQQNAQQQQKQQNQQNAQQQQKQQNAQQQNAQQQQKQQNAQQQQKQQNAQQQNSRQQQKQQKQQNAQQQKQQKQDPQQQQRQNSIDQAKQEAEKLQRQAADMKQSELEKSAQKAAEELQKAAEADRKREQAQAQKHIENALKELQKHDDQGKGEQKKQPQSSQGGKQQPKQEEKGDSPRPAPGERPRQDISKKNAEQLLELMGEEDKKLREALKQRRNMRRAQVEKDW